MAIHFFRQNMQYIIYRRNLSHCRSKDGRQDPCSWSYDNGDPYGVNLSQRYARREDGQADLTTEQVERIQQILENQTVIWGISNFADALNHLMIYF